MPDQNFVSRNSLLCQPVSDTNVGGQKRIEKFTNDLDDECGICLDNVSVENAPLIPCLHKFHEECLDKWRDQGRRGKPYTCPICRTHLGTNERICCADCDVTFYSKQSLDQHQREANHAGHYFECRACLLEFGSEAELRQHEFECRHLEYAIHDSEDSIESDDSIEP